MIGFRERKKNRNPPKVTIVHKLSTPPADRVRGPCPEGGPKKRRPRSGQPAINWAHMGNCENYAWSGALA